MNEKIEKLLANKQWYHQRFDGSPMFLFAVGEAELKRERRKPRGTEADVRVCFFSQGKADWYLDMGDIERGTRVIIERAKKDRQIAKKFLHAWQKDEQAFEHFFGKNFLAFNWTLFQTVNFWPAGVGTVFFFRNGLLHPR